MVRTALFHGCVWDGIRERRDADYGGHVEKLRDFEIELDDNLSEEAGRTILDLIDRLDLNPIVDYFSSVIIALLPSEIFITSPS